MSARTIQIFLPDGSPKGIRIAEITSTTVKVISIPRHKLEEAAKREELQNVGLYFLFGSPEYEEDHFVYIGEAENCLRRLKQHNAKKEFWDTALVVVSKTNSFTKAHVKYLEHYTYKRAKEANHYKVMNDVVPTESFITEPMKADLMDNFGTIQILLETLGYPVFEGGRQVAPIRTPILVEDQQVDSVSPSTLKETSQVEPNGILICKGKDAYATGKYIDGKLAVQKGSKANIEEAATAGASLINKRAELLSSGVLERKGNVYVFMSDYVFDSPSSAASVVLGRRANGWTEWKSGDGQTLDSLYPREK